MKEFPRRTPNRPEYPGDLNPDPLYPDPEPVRRHAGTDRPGMVIVWIVLATLIALGVTAFLVATPRPAVVVIPVGVTATLGAEARAEGALNGNPPRLTGAPHDRNAAGSPNGPVSGAPQARRISGTATWYCSATSACTRGYRPSDMVAAIDSDLGFRKGDRIRVSYFGRSVVVRIVDVCACAGDRLIDLTSGAFRRLAPLELGVIPVMLELAGPAPRALPTAPATDTDGG